MRKRLKKKIARKKIFESINWWDDDAVSKYLTLLNKGDNI